MVRSTFFKLDLLAMLLPVHSPVQGDGVLFRAFRWQAHAGLQRPGQRRAYFRIEPRSDQPQRDRSRGRCQRCHLYR